MRSVCFQVGMRQAHALGLFLRRLYVDSGFLSAEYCAKQVPYPPVCKTHHFAPNVGIKSWGCDLHGCGYLNTPKHGLILGCVLYLEANSRVDTENRDIKGSDHGS